MSLPYGYGFGGANYLSVANYTGNPAAFSVSGWVKPFQTQLSRVFFANFLTGGTNKGWAVGISDSTNNKIKFYLGSNTLSQSGTISNFVWTHFVVTYDGTTAKLYLNGNTTPDATLTSAVVYGATPTNNYIASLDGTNQMWLGGLSGLGVWSKALSTTEVTSLYNSGAGLAGADLSGTLLTSLTSYHNLDSLATPGTDSSGNGHTMTATGQGSVWFGPAPPSIPGTTAKPASPVLQSGWSVLAGYNLGEGSGSTAADLSGNAHTGTLTGSCTWSSGTYGNQLAIADNSTTGSYLALGNLTALSGVTAFTLSALCQLGTYTDSPRAGNLRALIGTSRPGAGASQAVISYNALTRSIHFNARYTDFPDLVVAAPPLSEWHLITGRVTGNVQSLWYDGTKVAEQAVASYAYASDITPVGAIGDIYGQQSGNNWSGLVAMGLFATAGYSDAQIGYLAGDPFVWDRSLVGTIAPTEAADSGTAAVTTTAGGALAPTEATDLLSGTGGLAIAAALTGIELGDLLAGSGGLATPASLAVVESLDILATSGGASVAGSAGVVGLIELGDIGAMPADRSSDAVLGAIEANDIGAMPADRGSGAILILGELGDHLVTTNVGGGSATGPNISGLGVSGQAPANYSF
jgi:hypothetical protein